MLPLSCRKTTVSFCASSNWESREFSSWRWFAASPTRPEEYIQLQYCCESDGVICSIAVRFHSTQLPSAYYPNHYELARGCCKPRWAQDWAWLPSCRKRNFVATLRAPRFDTKAVDCISKRWVQSQRLCVEQSRLVVILLLPSGALRYRVIAKLVLARYDLDLLQTEGLVEEQAPPARWMRFQVQSQSFMLHQILEMLQQIACFGTADISARITRFIKSFLEEIYYSTRVWWTLKNFLSDRELPLVKIGFFRKSPYLTIYARLRTVP